MEMQLRGHIALAWEWWPQLCCQDLGPHLGTLEVPCPEEGALLEENRCRP